MFNILTVLSNVFPAGEQSSSLISATNLVHQELSNLIRWSDNILLRSTTKETTHSTASTQDSQETPVQSEVGQLVDRLKIAVNDLVQVVIHKAANQIPPPSTAIECISSPTVSSPAVYATLTADKD